MKNLITITLLLLGVLTVNSQTYIAKEQAILDLDFFNKTLLDVHFNPFLYVEKETYDLEVEQLKSSMQDSIKIKDFIKSLYWLTSLLEDSHSNPGIYQSKLFNNEYKKEQFFPYKTFIYKNKLYISPDSTIDSGMSKGSEIISINSVKIDSFLVETQEFIGGIPEYKSEFTNRFLSHYLFLSDITPPFVIEYKEPSGNISNKTVENGITYINALLKTVPGVLEGNTFKIIDDKVGYIDFRNMSGSWQDMVTFLDSAFVSFKEKNIKHLAIDLRNNSGGDSMLADVLLSYLTDEKYKLMGTKNWKVSQQYKDHLIANGNSKHRYLEHDNGSIWQLKECEPSSNNFKAESKFDGKVYFLTGPFTFSSGNMLAAGVKKYKLAEIVGQPTGEKTNDFGEVYSFLLPNSKIYMNITTSYDLGPGCDESLSSSVIPDVLINNSLSELVSGEDKTLQYVLDKAH